MTSTNFTKAFTVDQTPEQAFAAITNVRGWWSGQIDGDTDKLGAEFTYRYQDIHYSRQQLAELAPNKKVVWRVQDAYLDFTEDPAEWNGTEITFELARKGWIGRLAAERHRTHPTAQAPAHSRPHPNRSSISVYPVAYPVYTEVTEADNQSGTGSVTKTR